MDLIILLPGFVCCAVLLRKSVRHAFLYVYLPVLLLLPAYFVLKLPHVPPITFTDAAILPLGAALAATGMRQWRPAWMDLWVFLFALSAAISEGLSFQLAYGGWVRLFTANSAASGLLSYNINNGIFRFFAALTSILLPYMAGKLLIENRAIGGRPMRKAALRMMVLLLTIVAAFSVIEFVSGTSVWQRVFRRLFPGQPIEWTVQTRWGFGRAAGPYGHAILAGMIFLTGLIYCLWLFWIDRGWGVRRLLHGVPMTQRWLMLVAIVAGLVMTQSRGPWVGVILALVFAGLVRAMPVTKAAAVFLLLMIAAGGLLLYFGDRYTRGQREFAATPEQESAMYRRQLLETYMPVVKERAAFGWGFIDYPGPNGQKSVDNQYLWIAVTQGLVGLGLFFMIAGGTGLRLLHWAARPIAYEDRALVFAHMAALMGLLVSLATVFLGEEVVMVFFLLIGWVQGMNPVRLEAAGTGTMGTAFKFRRVLN